MCNTIVTHDSVSKIEDSIPSRSLYLDNKKIILQI